MNRMKLLGMLALLLLASQVSGTVPNVIHYQGVLTDDSGVVVADGAYKLTVRLYDVATGGSSLYTESHDAVAVVGGVFSAAIGSVNTALGALDFNDPYYLSLEVNDSGVELSPRVAIQAVPYALNASRIAGTDASGFLNSSSQLSDLGDVSNAAPATDDVLQFDGAQWIPAPVSGSGSGDITSVVAGEGLTGGATTGDATLDVAPGAGLQVSGDQVGLSPPYETGSAYDGRFVNQSGDTITGFLHVGGNLSVDSASDLYIGTDLATDDDMVYFDDATEAVFWDESDSQFEISDDLATRGSIQGGYVGTQSTFNRLGSGGSGHGLNNTEDLLVTDDLEVNGTLFADGGLSAAGAVSLPAGAVGALEIADEAGLAQATTTGTAILDATTTMVDVETVSITIPAAGYIVLEAKSIGYFRNTTGTNRLFAQIDETTGGSTVSPHWVRVGLNAYASGANYTYLPVYCTRTYYKSAAGTYTFRLEAGEDSENATGNSCGLYQTVLRAAFYSSSYGTVQTTAARSRALTAGAPGSGAEPGESGDQGVTEIDLRELELRATEARLRALEAERDLQRAQEEVTANRP